MSSATYNWKLYWYMIFNLVWLQARQTGSSIKTKVLLGVMLIDTTVHQEILVKQALKVDVFTGGPSRGTAMAIRVSSSVSGSSQCRSGTAVGYLAISIDDLDACRRRGNNHRSGRHRHRPSRHNGSGGRPTRDTCVTHGGERATNDGMRLRHPGILAGRRKQVAAEQAPDAGDSGQPDTHELVCHVGHCLPPTATPWGTSSVCASSLN